MGKGRLAEPSWVGKGRLACIASVLALACLPGCFAASPPNVLLVVVDTLRADHTSAYGYPRDTTPRLNALAEAGARFDASYAPMGLTGPSHASLFTALHPLSHGVVKNGLALGGSHLTLAEQLAGQGYQTAAVVSSFVLHNRFGLSQGFSHYDDDLDPAEGTIQLETWQGHGVERGFDRRADHTARRAIDWLQSQRNQEQPFFLFVHFFDPHSPWAPGARFEEQLAEPTGLERLVARYDAEIAFTDAMLGRILDSLDDAGLAEETLVVVTGDHGEGLMQRGYMLHGVSVHEEEVRVPLVVRWTGRIAGGQQLPEPVALVDVAPSVAELAGFAVNGNFAEGRSFAAALLGEGRLDPLRPVYLQRRRFAAAVIRPAFREVLAVGRGLPAVAVEGERFALRRGRWKYLVADEAEAQTALYDLERDPGESENLLERHPARAEQLRAELEEWIQARRASTRPAEYAVLDAERRMLRRLGYTH